jgi:hypothetical protein
MTIFSLNKIENYWDTRKIILYYYILLEVGAHDPGSTQDVPG